MKLLLTYNIITGYITFLSALHTHIHTDCIRTAVVIFLAVLVAYNLLWWCTWLASRNHSFARKEENDDQTHYQFNP